MDDFETSSSERNNSPPRNSIMSLQVNINLNPNDQPTQTTSSSSSPPPPSSSHINPGGSGNNSNSNSNSNSNNLSRYENQKRRDWNTFGQYLRNHRPPLSLSRCSGAHVLEFLRYLDQFGKTKVHAPLCPFFGHPSPPAPCPCPLRQAWGSLDALVGRLRAAFEEHAAASPDSNPFAARAVRLYLREVRDSQSKARGVSYDKKKRKRPPPTPQPQPTLPQPPANPTIMMMFPPPPLGPGSAGDL